MGLAPRIPRAVPGKSVIKTEARKERIAKPHMDMVRAIQMCAATGRIGAVDVHHLMRGEGVVRGMGMKAPGRYVIPLCRRVHDEITPTPNPEQVLMNRYGLDARALADALWQHRGNLNRMSRAVGRHYLDARQRMDRSHGD